MSNPLKFLAATLLVIGIVILALGEPESSPENLTLTFSEFDQIVKTPVEKTDALALAEFLIEQKEHYNLIDLQAKNASYQIPTSDAHTIESFLQKEIPINESIILYSENETKAIQLYYLLLIRGYFKVKVLAGGVMAWEQAVLQPSRNDIAKDSLKRRKAITRFFGGVIRGSSSDDSDRISVPPKPVVLKKKNKKHKGC